MLTILRASWLGLIISGGEQTVNNELLQRVTSLERGLYSQDNTVEETVWRLSVYHYLLATTACNPLFATP